MDKQMVLTAQWNVKVARRCCETIGLDAWSPSLCMVHATFCKLQGLIWARLMSGTNKYVGAAFQEEKTGTLTYWLKSNLGCDLRVAYAQRTGGRLNGGTCSSGLSTSPGKLPFPPPLPIYSQKSEAKIYRRTEFTKKKEIGKRRPKERNLGRKKLH